jgi:glucan endo-1,3-alpha-glucosidase
MMVGNTFPFTQADWAKDIALAHSVGIDGFALNI